MWSPPVSAVRAVDCAAHGGYNIHIPIRSCPNALFYKKKR